MKKVICLLLGSFMLYALTGCDAMDKALEVKDMVLDSIDTSDTPVEELTLEQGVLTVGMYMHMAPLASVTEDTVTPVGFEVDLAQALADSLGLKLKMIDISQANLLPSLEADLVDCIISSVPITQNTDEQYLTSRPYADLTKVADQLPETVTASEIAIFTSEHNDHLMTYLDNALASLVNNGKLSLLSETHFSKDITISEE